MKQIPLAVLVSFLLATLSVQAALIINGGFEDMASFPTTPPPVAGGGQ
jgi:hypothetical protein